MPIEKILVVDSDPVIRNFLTDTLHRKKMDITAVENGQKALQILKETTFDMVISAMKLPDVTGLEILTKTKELSPSTIVLIITAYGSIENAVEAMRLGAFYYLQKPFSAEEIDAILNKAKEHITLLAENSYLRNQLSTEGSRTGRKIIGESPAMKKILSDVAQIANSQSSVFVTGESGTGKEVIAQAIHFLSPRSQRPFIKVNCAAVPETLIESEFFGHERGAFTGASNKRLGRFELANEGSLLLDEVTEIPSSLQAKLLRVVQEREFERVGGTKPIRVDVRIISTSNRDIKEAVANKVLRGDLYYRLNVIPIHLPPLRDRREDVIPLAEYFLEKMCLDNRKPLKHLTADAKKQLLQYPWPGNIRELANIIERAIVMDDGAQIAGEHLHLDSASALSSTMAKEPQIVCSQGVTLQELEKRHIIETLSQHHDQERAAELLGITPRVLKTKLKQYNI